MGVLLSNWYRPCLAIRHILLGFVLLVVSSGMSYAAQHRVALVIGNSDYENLTMLRTPTRDAETLSDTLSSLGFTVYLAENLATQDFHNAFRFFAEKVSHADVALVYFAGHGARINGQNYLFPTDFDLTEEAGLQRAVNLSDVQTLLSQNETINLMFIDSCQDTPVGSLSEPLANLAPLTPETPDLGTMVAYASSPGQVAFDGSGRHSLFTGALLDNITKPNVDVETMLRAVRRDVLKNSQGAQLPQTLSSLVSDFAFIPPAVNAHLAIPSTQESLKDIGFSRKPVLAQISDGLTAVQPSVTKPSLKTEICAVLPFPKPSECLASAGKQLLSE